jgi:hypothetical protein
LCDNLLLILLFCKVGLSFLAGLCFAVLLIPVNKCLAVRIRKYSENMMEKKDSRVKVGCTHAMQQACHADFGTIAFPNVQQ